LVPSTFEAVVILLLAIAPGFIAIATWARAKTWKGFGGDLDTVLRSLVASLLVQVPMFPVALWWGLFPNYQAVGSRAGALFVWLLLTAVIVPVGGGLLLGALYDHFLAPLSREPEDGRQALRIPLKIMGRGPVISLPPALAALLAPKPPAGWDRFVLQHLPEGAFLVLYLADGTQVGGTWEHGSFAMTSPADPSIFLPREWIVDGGGRFAGFVDDTHGVFVPDAATIRRIRVLL
jgi:Family of unknown function (DUF6338)